MTLVSIYVSKCKVDRNRTAIFCRHVYARFIIRKRRRQSYSIYACYKTIDIHRTKSWSFGTWNKKYHSPLACSIEQSALAAEVHQWTLRSPIRMNLTKKISIRFPCNLFFFYTACIMLSFHISLLMTYKQLYQLINNIIIYFIFTHDFPKEIQDNQSSIEFFKLEINIEAISNIFVIMSRNHLSLRSNTNDSQRS